MELGLFLCMAWRTIQDLILRTTNLSHQVLSAPGAKISQILLHNSLPLTQLTFPVDATAVATRTRMNLVTQLHSAVLQEQEYVDYMARQMQQAQQM